MQNKHLHVTQCEIPFPTNANIVSTTDVSGNITSANQTFVAISGYSLEELIGSPHNIVRHPDMPAAAFSDLWKTIKSGRAWRGIVKNRCKNGDHYWVEAFVVPQFRDGVVCGYLSVRNEPTRKQIEDAEALYARINSGSPPARRLGVTLSIAAKLKSMSVALLVALLAIAGLGMWAVSSSNKAMQLLYERHLLGVQLAEQIPALLAESRAQILLGMQHDPAGSLSKLHDHDSSTHIEATLKIRKDVQEKIQALDSLVQSAGARAAFQEFVAAREKYSIEGGAAARKLLESGQYSTLGDLVVNRINPLFREVQGKSRALATVLAEEAAQVQAHERQRYEFVHAVQLSILAITTILLVLGLRYLLAITLNPIRDAASHLRKMASGDMNEDLDIARSDEIGELNSSLTMMQIETKYLIDEITCAARQVKELGTVLDERMNKVVEQSLVQQANVEAVAAATEEFSESANEVTQSTHHAASAASESQELLLRSHRQIESGVTASLHVEETVLGASSVMTSLNDEIGKIGVIAGSISEIAGKTNLLALNAAIEAARAGEQGRGFAVVAGEVGKLADRTAHSTGEIADAVESINRAARAAFESMNAAVTQVRDGTAKLRESVGGLDAVTGASRQVSDLAAQISDSSKQQSEASYEVASKMQRISDLIEGNSKAAHAAQETSQELLEIALELEQHTRLFKIYRRAKAA